MRIFTVRFWTEMSWLASGGSVFWLHRQHHYAVLSVWTGCLCMKGQVRYSSSLLCFVGLQFGILVWGGWNNSTSWSCSSELSHPQSLLLMKQRVIKQLNIPAIEEGKSVCLSMEDCERTNLSRRRLSAHLVGSTVVNQVKNVSMNVSWLAVWKRYLSQTKLEKTRHLNV